MTTSEKQPAVWIDGDPLMEAIAAAVWERCRTEHPSSVVDDPRNIAAVAATVARAQAGAPSAPVDCPRCRHDERTRGVIQLSTFELYPPDHADDCPVGLRDRIAGLFRFPPGGERLGDATPGEIADAVLAVLPAPADRAVALTEAAARPATLHAIANHLEARAVQIFRPDAEVYAGYHSVAALLRRLAAEAHAVVSSSSPELAGPEFKENAENLNNAAEAHDGDTQDDEATVAVRIRDLHQPMQRGPFTICAHCSGWDGRWRCLGVVTDYPCPTVRALDGVAVEHLGGNANAEDCPGCKAERRNLPYPFLCPAETEPAVPLVGSADFVPLGAAEVETKPDLNVTRLPVDQLQADETDLTEVDVDRMMAAGVPVQIVTEPPATHAASSAVPPVGSAEPQDETRGRCSVVEPHAAHDWLPFPGCGLVAKGVVRCPGHGEESPRG